MFFLVFSVISGVALIGAPIYLFKRFKKEWKMPDKLFLRAGFVLLLIELFHLSVLDSGISHWPTFANLHFVWQALILGLFSGLVFELGRFFALDKLFKKVRKYKDGMYFSLGWNGVGTFFLGVILILGSIGLYALLASPDLATLFPDASADELEQLREYKQQANDVMQMNPLFGLTPIIERASILALDMLLTLIILLGFFRGTFSYVWISVLVRTLFITLVYIGHQIDPLLSVGIFIVLGALCTYGTIRIKEYFLEITSN